MPDDLLKTNGIPHVAQATGGLTCRNFGQVESSKCRVGTRERNQLLQKTCACTVSQVERVKPVWGEELEVESRNDGRVPIRAAGVGPTQWIVAAKSPGEQ